MAAIATSTNLLYPSNTLVRNRPPGSMPKELKTAGITAPMITINPPTQIASARQSTTAQTSNLFEGVRDSSMY
ncbi:MAG: hypothetical protein A3K11_15500 [Nitrospirae bacterium RIFCSPLOWO2_12_FULL_63_8]|nr:MAG: hypothetical protein A3K11_15500 [Nitrospirae bacterium RIFCSPLOWO2_12_FULL_63_8]